MHGSQLKRLERIKNVLDFIAKNQPCSIEKIFSNFNNHSSKLIVEYLKVLKARDEIIVDEYGMFSIGNIGLGVLSLKQKQDLKYIKKKFDEDPSLIKQLNPNKIYKSDEELKIRNWFNKLTRLQFNNELPKQCEVCGTIKELEIHHKKHSYPIKREDLIRLCKECHRLEHRKIKFKNKELFK